MFKLIISYSKIVLSDKFLLQFFRIKIKLTYLFVTLELSNVVTHLICC